MKKICAFALALIFTSGINAQLSSKLGIKGGLNIAGLQTQTGNTDVRYAPHVGLLAHLHLSRQVALQPEILYSGQGMVQRLGGRDFRWNLDYVQIPLMLQYMFDNGFRIEAGPQLGFLASARIKGPTETTNERDRLKSIDVGLGFGLSYLGNSGLGIGARYNHGLTNIASENFTNELRNRVGQLSVFYMFDNDHKRRRR